ncbi:hypothetical protein RDABS01_027218 [Bienertia sinuspersici]
MEKLHLLTYSLILCVVLSLALLSFIFCIIAEFKKLKVNDLMLDGKLCELPESAAFWFGIAALICFISAQIIGNMIILVGNPQNSKERRSCCQFKSPTIAGILLLISWINFGTSVILISTATSMNRRQLYGKGWLDGECYLVKNGVFVGAAVLVLVSLGCTFASAILTLREQYHVSAHENAKKVAFLNET